MSKKDAFYQDLDKSKDKKGWCSCVSLVVAFIVLLAGAEIFLFLTAKNFKYNPKEDVSFSLPSSFESSVKPIELDNQAVRLTISQGQLCKMIIDGGVNSSGLECAIDEEAVKITGKLSAFLPSNTSVSVLPKAQNGKIVLEVKKVEVGMIDISVSLFKLFIGKIENLINSNEAVKSINVQTCQLGEGMIVVEGTKRNDK